MKLYLNPPKPAPFKTGTKLRFKANANGTKQGNVIDGVTYWQESGTVVEVVEEAYGSQGTGRLIDDEDEPIYDETEDFSSVIRWPWGYQSLVCHEYADHWEIVR